MRCHAGIILVALSAAPTTHAADLPNKVYVNKVHSCDAFPVNSYVWVPTSPDQQTLSVSPSDFAAVPLSEDDLRLGYVARYKSDHVYVLIPNRLEARTVSWMLFKSKGGKHICGSRIVATFAAESSTELQSELAKRMIQRDPQATFLRPILQQVQVEFTTPFLGFVRRFDPRPTFPLGGILIVWDLDNSNTNRLSSFLRNAPDPTELPGIVFFRELQTGLNFSSSLSLEKARLQTSMIDVY